MNCPIHTGVVMTQKEGKYGPFWSHKTEDGWCNGKPKYGSAPYTKVAIQDPITIDEDVPFPDEPAPKVTEPAEATTTKETDWVAIGREKALCGFLNARLQTKTPAQVLLEFSDLARLLQHVEAEAKRAKRR